MSPRRVVVFAGPSLPPAVRPGDPRLVWRPPARAGDILELDPEDGDAVVLLDGLFDAAPAVRHKELLGLMSRGVGLIGAASMGALRAAELDAFGMRGVGLIYRAYASGRLVGDDEVALLHAPEEMGWMALTEPLVNVRATLHRAARRGVLSNAGAQRLFGLAKATFYQDRTWPLLLDQAGESGLAAAERRGFSGWLARGRVDLKRIDALRALSTALAGDMAAPACGPPPATPFTARLAAARPPSG